MNERPRVTTGTQEGVLQLGVEQALTFSLNHIKAVLNGEQRLVEISHISYSPYRARIWAYPTFLPIGVVEQVEDRIFVQLGIDPDLAVPTKVIDLGDEFDDTGQYVREIFSTGLRDIFLLRDTHYATAGGLLHDYSKTPRHDPSAIWNSSLSIINVGVPDRAPQAQEFFPRILRRLHR